MSKDIQAKLKLSGVNKLMRSPPIQAKINAGDGRMAARADAMLRITPSPHRWTARAFVEVRPGETMTDADRLALL